ncbi:MAG: hypothetical protein ACI3YJ_08030, partial [Prevotella sp.]
MKKLYTKLALAVAMIFVGFASANAQEKLSVEPVSVAPNEEVDVVVNYSSEVARSGFNMEIILPENLSFVGFVNEDEEEEWTALGSSELSSHIKVEGFVDEATKKHIKIVVFHAAMKNLKDGVLLSFKVKADENLPESSEIQFKGICFNGGEYLENFTVAVTKGTPTAISGIEA